MGALPRLITVDPTGAVARLARAALDLIDRPVVQIDVPRGVDALSEVEQTGCQVLIAALRLTDELHGIDLALKVKQTNPTAALIVIGDANDPPALDEAYPSAPFVYLRRPVDGAQFLRLLATGLDGGNILAADAPPVRRVQPDLDMGTIPLLDMKIAERVVDTLLIDVGAMAIVLSNRGGHVLLERGAVGYLDREQLTNALLPMVRATVQMGQLVGGQTASLQFYDGSQYDVFVLSVGYHHFMCLVFDGQIGSRQFGAVNRFGRRAAEDLIAILGMAAFAVAPPPPVVEAAPPPEEAPADEPLIERGEEWAQAEHELRPEPEPVRLEPIANFDLSLFDKKMLDSLDISLANELFDPDKLAEIANETRQERGPLSYEEARQLGIIP